METVKVLFPVVLMLVMGFILKKTQFISEKGIADIKKYITLIALPVVIFNAMGIADISKETMKIVGAMITVFIVAILIGHFARGIVKEPYKNYLMFLVTCFEGGLFAYPLYQNMVGEDKLVNIVVVDIAGAAFGFGVYFGLLALVDQKTKFSVRAIGRTAFSSPTFIGLVLGLFLNLTGVMDLMLKSPVGAFYESAKDMITAPLTPLILICVGYAIEFDKKLVAPCLKTVVLRLLIMTAGCFFVIKVLGNVMDDRYMLLAVLTMFICPPTFSLPNFVKNKEAASYFSMTISIYTILTIIAYAVLTATVTI